jgi:uncharacterized protein (TIGR03083 family)
MIGFDAVTAMGTPARLELDLAAPPAELLLRQRTRLADRLAGLSGAGWHRATRCPLWDVADVVTHLGDATGWGLEALAAAGTGDVPRFLQGFDPGSTPHEHVLAGRGSVPEALLARLREGTGALADTLRAADPSAAPSVPWVGGHNGYSAGLAGLHILWDSWLHELDLDIALAAEGIAPGAPCAMELDAVAAYGIFFAGIAFARVLGPGMQVSLRLDLGELAYDLRVGEAVRLSRAAGPSAPGALVVRGPAVPTVDALAGRGELAEVATGDAQALALMSGLGSRMRAPAARAAAG